MEDMLDLLTLRKRFFESLVVSITIVIPFVAGLSYLVLKRIVKPIKNVASVALSLIEGDFSVRADESLKGEIGLLGKTINELSVELYRNISQLYIEKNRLQQVLNSLDEGMIAVDEGKMITHYNKAFLNMFTLDEVYIKGGSIENIIGLNEELRELSQAIEGKYPIIKNIKHDEIILRTVIAPIENEKAEVVGAVILFRDITELEKLEVMRRDYVANVSHELRSPLTSIRGLIEPLKDAVVTEEEDKKRYYEIIYQESLRLSRLIDDIMELSRLQTSDAEIEKTYIDITTLLEMVYERYKLLDDNIDLQYKAKTLPKVYSNYDRIEQILVILLDNAYKFTSKGGEIEILPQVMEGKLTITIKDTGLGISKEDLPYIFDRFYKSDKSRSKRGTGLGLSIAKEILNIMGENIEVQSELGKGSAFTFTIHTKTR
jgi:PAS domain S-box-containing protein